MFGVICNRPEFKQAAA